MKIDPETKKRHLQETALRLRDEGYSVEWQQTERLIVTHENGLLCSVENPGGVSYRQGDMTGPEIIEAREHVYEVSSKVAEYMRNMDRAPDLKVPGVPDKYKLLAEFNGTVLAGVETKYGVNFVTWDRDFNYEGLSHGHYYSNNYEGAKQDFATRSGLISDKLLFDQKQIVQIYQCCADTLEGDYEVTDEQEKTIQGIQDQIEDAVPDIRRQIADQYREPAPEMSM